MRKPCCEREEETSKGCWSKQEDQKLMDYIHKHGEGSWRSLPQAAGLCRSGKSCRLRWINYLRPNLKHGNFGEDEEDLIIRLHALLGNRWSLIAGRLPGRTDREVKNYWNSHIRKKLIQKGHDPDNLHRLKGSSINGTAQQAFDPKDETCKRVNLYGMKTQVISADSTSDDDDNDEDQCNVNTLPDLNLDLTLSTCSNGQRETLKN